VAGFVAIELTGLLVSETYAAIGHCVLIAILLLGAAARPGGLLGPLRIALALPSLLRLLSLTLPPAPAPVPVRVTLVGSLMLLAAMLVLRRDGDVLRRLGLPPSDLVWQAGIGLAGVPLSLSVFAVLRPGDAALGDSAAEIAAYGLALALFGGAMEELVFRGVVQQAAVATIGPSGVALTAVLYGATYIGTVSPSAVLVVGAIGWILGWAREQSGSIAGVVIAHALLDVLVFLVWPRVFG
jgi:membrane protease YdiL (CAAX protease family)